MQYLFMLKNYIQFIISLYTSQKRKEHIFFCFLFLKKRKKKSSCAHLLDQEDSNKLHAHSSRQGSYLPIISDCACCMYKMGFYLICPFVLYCTNRPCNLTSSALAAFGVPRFRAKRSGPGRSPYVFASWKGRPSLFLSSVSNFFLQGYLLSLPVPHNSQRIKVQCTMADMSKCSVTLLSILPLT